MPIDWMWSLRCELIRTQPAATSESQPRISVRSSVYTLRRINNDRCGLSRLSKIAHFLRPQSRCPVSRPDQLSGASLGLTLFGMALFFSIWFGSIWFGGSGAGALSAMLDRVVCISVHEYPNSCPHFKQTWYVRFLIVNTALRWR